MVTISHGWDVAAPDGETGASERLPLSALDYRESRHGGLVVFRVGPGLARVYREQIRPVIDHGADIMDRIVPERSGYIVTQTVTHHRARTGLGGITHLLSWSGWPDLNRRPLRPEPRER